MIDNLILEHLKRIEAEQSTIREHNREVITRLGSLEATVARTYAELVSDRITMDGLRDRIERIERRLELI